MKSNLEECVDEALERRLNELNFTRSEQLLGDCYYNTKILIEVLEEHNITYDVFCGGLAGDYSKGSIPESFEIARNAGFVHYWVESNGFVCEIAGECSLGKPIVISERPDDYIVFNDSRRDSLPDFNN